MGKYIDYSENIVYNGCEDTVELVEEIQTKQGLLIQIWDVDFCRVASFFLIFI